MASDLSVEEEKPRISRDCSEQQDNKEENIDLEALPAASPPAVPKNPNELTGWKLTLLIASLCSAVFCVALDNTSKS